MDTILLCCDFEGIVSPRGKPLVYAASTGKSISFMDKVLSSQLSQQT